ncbi:MAG: nicotinate-nucleotide adenylyltransferase [Thiohalomonadales bacterium]
MIGVYGGTFDPIHYGHLRPVLDVVEALSIEKCHFIPCSIPYHRALPLASSKQRLEMIATAIKLEPRFYLDPREINREGISYTIDTLEFIRTEVTKNQTLCLIIGIDAFYKFDQWYRWKNILDLCHIVVTHRPGWDVEALRDSSQISVELGTVISNQRILNKDELNDSSCGKIMFQSVTQLDISATKIRALLAENKSVQYLLPDGVIKIIKNQNIYENKR